MNETATSRLSIGAFARASMLTLKALRLYDDLGLLPPDYVDPASGYRYYRPEQLRAARLIGLLRQLGMPLGRIARVLDLEAQAASREIAGYWREAEAEMAKKRKLVRYLENYLEGKGQRMFEIQTRSVPQQKVLTVQRSVQVKDLPGFIDRSIEELQAQLGAQGAEQEGAPFVIYHGQVNEDSDGPVEVCLPFCGSVEPAGDLRVRLEPAREEAYATITEAQCEFPGILEAYDAVARWLVRQQRACWLSPREVYFADLKGSAPDAPFCDIAYPYRPL
ncbi:DNA-binding transcriptional MerR regulator [Deinobacterium chartae]|uniref:DNA-binding transcriptional MerR regulator n=1 Tax=Deinobacterium chartae TaxID=521158 RepID=A0A841HW77_9DEIO|nr:helix-turn-helix domain-containing protein [Deinobacterium chartae]MBB6097647.1 DNA-binding transcriptional MerR regulator [Deinobacterium chartae]